jgi:hypothetical protein
MVGQRDRLRSAALSGRIAESPSRLPYDPTPWIAFAFWWLLIAETLLAMAGTPRRRGLSDVHS